MLYAEKEQKRVLFAPIFLPRYNKPALLNE